ncbi:MAG: regulatory protein GemA [Salinisphaeraceae bacterium]
MSDRNAQLAKIHIAVKDLGLDDAAYREMLWTVARVRSAKDLDPHGRQQVLEHLKARGWHPLTRGRGGHARLPEDRQALRRKIDAMLAGADRPAAYGDAMARRICKVERLDWCTPDQLRKVVAALSYDQKRRQAHA